ncbi:MAG: DUF1566 domain-containing protein [Bacteroidota bacterium]
MKKYFLCFLLIVAVGVFVSCKKVKVDGCMDATALNYNSTADVDDNSCIYYAYGQNYAGGLVFYIDASKKHGLVCAPIDQGAGVQFAYPYSPVAHAIGTEIGTGQANTDSIIAVLGTTGVYAAQLCDALVSGGYSDWYLPALQELLAMNTNLKMKNLGNLSTGNYWSSSETNNDEAWVVYFSEASSYLPIQKSNWCCVRAIRAF